MSTVHVVYDGRNQDLDLNEIFPEDRLESIGVAPGTDINSGNLTEQQVRVAVAQHYDIALEDLSDHYVEFSPNGNITVRPNTTFGK